MVEFTLNVYESGYASFSTWDEYRTERNELGWDNDFEIEMISGDKFDCALFRVTGQADMSSFFKVRDESNLTSYEKAIFVFLAEYGHSDLDDMFKQSKEMPIITDMQAHFDKVLAERFNISDRHPMYNYICMEDWLRDKIANSEFYEIKNSGLCFWVVNPYYGKDW